MRVDGRQESGFSVAYASEVALVEVGLEVGQDWRSMAIHHQSSMETFPIVIDYCIQCPREGNMWPSTLAWCLWEGVS